MLTRIIAVFGLLLGLLMLTPAMSATAAGVCTKTEQVSDSNGQLTWICTKWSDGDGDGDSGDDGSGPARVCLRENRVVPCEQEGPFGSSWNNAEQCWISLASPQPVPPGKKTAGDGAWYDCVPAPDGAREGARQVWFDGAPPSPAEPPWVLAQRVIAGMKFLSPTMGIVPESGEDKMGLIGLPTWMWVENPTPTTYGPQHVVETAGGMTITVDAQVAKVEWDMGDGTPTVICGLGTPYQDSYGSTDSPTCGHRYEHTSAEQPEGAYRVRAIATWEITWTAGDYSGAQVIAVRSQTRIRVGEMQVLVQ